MLNLYNCLYRLIFLFSICNKPEFHRSKVRIKRSKRSLLPQKNKQVNQVLLIWYKLQRWIIRFVWCKRPWIFFQMVITLKNMNYYRSWNNVGHSIKGPIEKGWAIKHRRKKYSVQQHIAKGYWVVLGHIILRLRE